MGDIFFQVLSSDNPRYGFNAATGKYEDLMAAGIIDPTKVSCSFFYMVFTCKTWLSPLSSSLILF